MEKKTIDPEKLAAERQMTVLKKEKMKLIRKKDRRKVPKEVYMKIINNLLKCFCCLIRRKYKTREETNYLIDESMIEKQFSILESQKTRNLHDRVVEVKAMSMIDNQKEVFDLAAIRKMMFYPKWWAHEILFIVFHMIVTGALMLPFIFLAILYEISYEPYSTISPEKLISL